MAARVNSRTLHSTSHSVPGTYTVSLTVTGTGGDTNVKKLENYITVTDLSTTTRTTAPVTSRSTGTTPVPTTTISRQPTPVVPTGQSGEMEAVYFIITGIVATIVVVAVILYKGAGTRQDKM